MKKMIFATIFAALSFSAMADQCQLLDKADAERGAQILSQSSVAFDFCEPCGDTAPQKMEIQTVEAVKSNYRDYYEVRVNGRAVDLAYTFDAQGQNVALQTSCSASDVSASIEVQ
ncbi:MAG: hypothetical protein EP326_08590 [Deltaproteobacteria bacterium]|nr:MAG: hypothetical protein EP326_08590 [Deltaproteobacteria bacterium]TNF26533.1 MAG: hypothetical protein EP319_13555 [Deltaproteobacteria bacterium]